jgi:hypothetical protein
MPAVDVRLAWPNHDGRTAGPHLFVRYYDDGERDKEVSQMGEVKQLLSMDDLQGLLAASAEKPVLLFKHSTT